MDTSLLPYNPVNDAPSLSDLEREVVKAVIEDNDRLDVSIPIGMDPQKLWAGLCGAAKIQQGASQATNKIKPILGRFLIVLQDSPELYQELGYHNYTDFMVRGMPEMFGISKTEAFQCRKVAERFPSLTPEEFKQIGVSKLYALAAITSDGEKDAEVLVEKAKDQDTTRKQLQEFAAEIQHRSIGEIQLTDVRITTQKETAQFWREMVKSPEIQAYCAAATGEPASEGVIFRRMMEECVGEWTAQGAAIRDTSPIA